MWLIYRSPEATAPEATAPRGDGPQGGGQGRCGADPQGRH